jgi:hypothetical protein
MLARPSGQAELLTQVPSGMEFMERLEARYHELEQRASTLQR